MARVGVVGYGMAGRGIHVPLLRQAGFDVVAVTTADPARVVRARAELPGARVLPDLDALLEHGPDLGLDLVVLASASGVHRDQALQVIDAGWPLVVDKPLAADAEQALEVVSAARAARVPLSVFQNCRYDRDVSTLGRLLRGGDLGDVVRVEMRWERWRPRPSGQWREVLPAAEGGGVLLDLHTHMVDAVVHHLGPVRTVHAELSCWTTTAEDHAFLSCVHQSGVVSHLGATVLAAVGGPRWRVLGTRGAYVVGGTAVEPGAVTETDDLDPEHCGWLYDGTGRTAVPAADTARVDYYRQVAHALDQAEPAAAQAAMPVDPRDAVHVLAVLDAARVAADRGTAQLVRAVGD